MRATLIVSASFSLLAFAGIGCGGATRTASPQPVTLTSASMPAASVIEGRSVKVMVGEKGMIAMVAKNGCLSIVYETKRGDEMAVQCPKADRLSSWLAANDPIALKMPLAKLDGEESEDIPLPAAQIMNAEGDIYRVARREDVAKLLDSVRTLSKELAAQEEPKPGPATPIGWQMIHVAGPAHVGIAGNVAQGELDARVSSTGQYLCEFSTNGLHAKKSGFIAKDVAPRALDEVLGPFESSTEASKHAFVSATAKGEEKRANAPSSQAVMERFGQPQDVLGDACLPEFEGAAPTKELGI